MPPFARGQYLSWNPPDDSFSGPRLQQCLRDAASHREVWGREISGIEVNVLEVFTGYRYPLRGVIAYKVFRIWALRAWGLGPKGLGLGA